MGLKIEKAARVNKPHRGRRRTHRGNETVIASPGSPFAGPERAAGLLHPAA